MERGLIMVAHSVAISVVLYLAMVFVAKQKSRVAEDRSVLAFSAILMYMMLFGHGLPFARMVRGKGGDYMKMFM